MGIRLAAKKWHAAAAFMAAPAMAFGYYAGDPNTLGININTTISGVGSVHSRHVPDAGGKSAQTKISREAAHLFNFPHKGPRADRYMEFTVSRNGVEPEPKPETKTARAPVQADMTATGSIPRDAAQAGVQESVVKASAPTAAGEERAAALVNGHADQFGQLPVIPVSGRTSASLFLASLTQPLAAGFPEFASGQDDENTDPGPFKDKIARGLKFQGESETEYQARQRRCLATAIYFEARGESIRGQLAVAQVVMNRVRSSLYPDTVCGVVFQGQWRRTGCQFSFACDGASDVPKDKGKWREANEVAKRVTDGESWLGDIGYATHYHANYVKPVWRRELNRVKQVGRHIFYRVKGEQIEDVLSEENPARGLALARSG